MGLPELNSARWHVSGRGVVEKAQCPLELELAIDDATQLEVRACHENVRLTEVDRVCFGRALLDATHVHQQMIERILRRAGVEPDLGLVKFKRLVGGGTMSFVNQSVPRALRNLGYSSDEVEAIIAHIDTNHTAVGAPGLDPTHLPVFACSLGDDPITSRRHP